MVRTVGDVLLMASLLIIMFISTAICTRPRSSLYCVIMLFALAQSSCYWQPVPASSLYASLASPPSSSVTSSVLSSAIASSTPPIDGMVRLIDRCWCDLGFGLSSGGLPNFFSPFDVSRWEARSIDRERRARLRDAEKETAIKESALGQGGQVGTSINNESSSDASAPSSLEATTNSPIPADYTQHPRTTGRKYKRISLLSFMVRRMLAASKNQRADSIDRELHSPNGSVPVSGEGEGETHSKGIGSARRRARPLPPHSLDLRPYGLGLVIDYGWGRS